MPPSPSWQVRRPVREANWGQGRWLCHFLVRACVSAGEGLAGGVHVGVYYATLCLLGCRGGDRGGGHATFWRNGAVRATLPGGCIPHSCDSFLGHQACGQGRRGSPSFCSPSTTTTTTTSPPPPPPLVHHHHRRRFPLTPPCLSPPPPHHPRRPPISSTPGAPASSA